MLAITPSTSGLSYQVCLYEKICINNRFSLCNSIGTVVYSENARLFGSGVNKIRINCTNLSSGFYYAKLTIENQMVTKKIAVIR